MNVTSHLSVLEALSARASRFSGPKRGGLGTSRPVSLIDETGTLDVTLLDGIDNNETVTLQQELRELNSILVPDEVLQVHGFAPARKAEGTIRLIYENINGLDTRMKGNEKLEKMRALHDDLEVDIAAYCEHKINYQNKNNNNGFNQLFRGGEADIRSIVSHNVHENVGKIQQGGTSLILFGHLTQHFDCNESGKDPSGLGRWSVMTLQGDGRRTRIVCGYNPCGNNKLNSGTSYQQQKRYFVTVKKDLTCPRKKFHDDLISQLKKWRDEGDRLVVCLDANEHIYRKSIGKSLTNLEGLNMSEVVGEFTGKSLGPTFFRGGKPIDAVWATQDIVVTHACVMPAGFGNGDHRMFVIDFQEESLIGIEPFKVQRFTARRLNTKVSSGASKKYVERFENSINKHRLLERLATLKDKHKSRRKLQEALNKLDRQTRELMANAEKKCRRIKSGRIPFSPEAATWIRRTQVYRSLLRYHEGKIRNRGNLKRTARHCGIQNCFQLTSDDIVLRLKICLKQCDHFRRNGKEYRRKHLANCLARAKEKEDSKKEQEILAIINRERDRAFWRRLNYVMGKSRSGSVRKVLIEDEENGTVTEHVTQETVQQAIFDNIHRKRFFLAEAAPACNGRLRGLFGYNATTITAQRILEGRYIYPEGFDQATKEICEECARIRLIVPKNSLNLDITRQDWEKQWRGKREETSSSESGLHFGHYIAGCDSEVISHLHALKATLVINRGIVLDRWARGLSVMLEKIYGCALITKLRSILLMEADFNSTNKITYGQRMLQVVRRHKLMPEEIYSEKNRLADDGTLVKVLFYDIVRQTRLPAGIGAVDADNCYDRIAHPIASMAFQSLGTHKEACRSFFGTIQDMKFFLRTGFGDSKDFASAAGDVKTQGLCQGNGAAPAGWTVDSIMMINAHKRKGHGIHLRTPITSQTTHLAGTLFVDDTDVEHLDMRKTETIEEAHTALQESITNWGRLLIATGGALKPSKCFYHMISFRWNQDGCWKYDSTENRGDLGIVVPLANGLHAAIDHLPVSTPTKTLGQMTCPTGSSIGAIQQMKKKAQAWIDKARGGNLNKRNVWFLLDKQFWPGVSFGISSITSGFQELDECMMRQYYDLLPISGIRRSVRKELRQLDRGFYGCGFPHPGVECMVGQISKLLTNYGCPSGLGQHLQTSMELLVIEAGVSSQILSMEYERYGAWVSSCWLKSVWEKICMFNLQVEIKELPLQPTRANDKWLMLCLEEAGYSKDELIRLNRVRCYQQVIFLSDIFGPNGRSIDRRYMVRRPEGDNWSTLIFPKEKPAPRDFILWRSALDDLAPRGLPRNRLGVCVRTSHKIYPSGSQHTEAIAESQPDFWRTLEKWGRTWMWNDLKWEGDDTWLVEAIQKGTCVAVTDGSYMPNLYPEMHSAAFVLECSNQTGRIWGSFPERSRNACSYRGELVGLMAIHLILLAVNETNRDLRGKVIIYSDCLGALNMVQNLPTSRIPTKCQHSDVLKNILVNCSRLSFQRQFLHVAAHQDDHSVYSSLSRPAQLNCAMDNLAKRAIWNLQATSLPVQRPFPLEPICIFAGQTKITADTVCYLRYWAHRKIAKEAFHSLGILWANAFDYVDWEMVHSTLRTVPRLFQVWACKQVMGIAGTMEWDRSTVRYCPSCTVERDTCSHVIRCNHEGRIETLRHTLELTEEWLTEADTDPDLLDCIMEYAHGRGERSMRVICEGLDSRFTSMAQEQDTIGWRRFMEGMICSKIREIQLDYHHRHGTLMNPQRWTCGLILKLMETTHGQWIYRNIQIHDSVSGTQTTLRKEAIQKEIEEQLERGGDGLLEEDQWMLEVNLGDLENTNGEKETYWLLAIKAARTAATLSRESTSNHDEESETGPADL